MASGDHRLTFNERVTAEVPIGLSRPGEYLFDLRETLLSMQRFYSMDTWRPRYAGGRSEHPQDGQAPGHQHDIQDTLPTPKE